PGTTTCRSIDGILVDTGSTGLRILASALPDLPSMNSGGNPVSECVQFPDQSYLWGNVVTADVRIAGEVARSLPLHSIGTQNGSSVPSDCSQNGAGVNAGTQFALGANGVLGVGYDPQDCGAACDPSAGGTPPSPAYYSCSAGSCNPTLVSIAHQVTNPIVTFLKDNNGLVLQFPGLDGASTKLDGTMTFGIGTQVNNQLGSATVFTIDSNHNFTTNLSSTAQSLTASGVNSGSSALFFPDDNLPQCGTAKRYFCPASSTSLASLQIGVNGAAGTINFVVENAEDLFNNNPGAAAFSALAGPNGTGDCAGGTGACRFEWGLPFFYGRTVFTAISGQTVPEGAPPSPWFAYTTGFAKK
ncbi:MAG TPA: DUF3443 family protein, partial [Terriglobales bacterium]|nr:DUF3443 family protein [Terriglobales bacterium]